MAESILKLKVDSQEYDSKIKRAADGLRRYVEVAHQQGDVIGRLVGETKKYVDSIGNMDTVNRTAKGSVNELKSAFTEFRHIYNQLSDEEKKGGFGKQLNTQLDQLKARIRDGEKELKTINDELGEGSGGMSGALDQLTGKLGINIKSLTLWGAALGAGKVALDVAKDAFYANESAVDEWGRIVASNEAVYNGFLNAINTGDISGYLDRINEIINAARAAYDELDKLGTMKTIQSPQFSKQEAENTRLRTMLMTGRWISAGDGRKSPLGLKDGDLLTPEQIKTLERQLQGGMNKIVSLTKNELDQTGKAIDAYYNSLAKQNGMSISEFRKGTSSWEEFSKRLQGAADYARFEREHTRSYTVSNGYGLPIENKVRDKAVNPYAEYQNWGIFRVDKMGQNSFNDLVNLIKQQQGQQSQIYSTIGQAYRTINRAEGVSVRNIMGGGGSGGGSKTTQIQTELQQNQKRINDLTQEYVDISSNATDATEERQKAIRDEISLLEKRNAALKLYAEQAKGKFLGNLPIQSQGLAVSGSGFAFATTISKEDIEKLSTAIAKGMKIAASGGNNKNPLVTVGGDGKTTAKLTDIMGGVASGIGQIVSGVEALGIEIPEGIKSALSVMQGISTILTGIATTVLAIEAISATDALIPFARGGIVPHAAGGFMIPGNDFSDRTPIFAQSGELILNRAQQGNIASQLEGGMNKIQVEGVVEGDNIVLVARRSLKKRGKDLVTWTMGS